MRKIHQRPEPNQTGLIRGIELSNNSQRYHEELQGFIEAGGVEIEMPYQYSFLLGLRSSKHVNVWFDETYLYFSALRPDRPIVKCPLFLKRYRAYPLGYEVDPDYDDMFCVFPTNVLPLDVGSMLNFEYVRNDLETVDRYLRAEYGQNINNRS